MILKLNQKFSHHTLSYLKFSYENWKFHTLKLFFLFIYSYFSLMMKGISKQNQFTIQSNELCHSFSVLIYTALMKITTTSKNIKKCFHQDKSQERSLPDIIRNGYCRIEKLGFCHPAKMTHAELTEATNLLFPAMGEKPRDF